VSREWPAIPGHHGDIEDGTVKRLRVLCHVSLSSLLTGGESRLGRGRVEDGSRWIDGERIRPSTRDHGVRSLSYSPSRVISGEIVHGMVRTVTGFHLPSRDGQ
jgi:hypothetical protein